MAVAWALIAMATEDSTATSEDHFRFSATSLRGYAVTCEPILPSGTHRESFPLTHSPFEVILGLLEELKFIFNIAYICKRNYEPVGRAS